MQARCESTLPHTGKRCIIQERESGGTGGSVTRLPSSAELTQAPPSVEARPARSRARIALLLELLRDDSPVVLQEVRGALRAAGRAARPALLRATRGSDPLLRSRARAMLLESARERAWRRLVGHARSGEIELERALFLLAAFQNPGTDSRPYRRALDRLGEMTAQRVRPLPADGSRARALAAFLGQELGIRGDRAEYHHPANACLTLAIERKRGLPLTLAALYRAVASRAGLRAELLPVPGHVLLRVVEGRTRTVLDPFDAGRVLGDSECRKYLARNGITWRAEYFQPTSDARMFLRQVGNLWRSARACGWTHEARQLAVLRRVLEERELRAARASRG